MSSSTTQGNPTSIFQRHFQNTFPQEGTREYSTYTTLSPDRDNETMLNYIHNVFERIGDKTFDINKSVGENIEFLSKIIFEEISMKKYTHQEDIKDGLVNFKPDGLKIVHRHNHNGLNHLRSMKFGLLFYDLIKNSNKVLFKKYIIDNIPDTENNINKIFFCILIGCMFTAILRISEVEAVGSLKIIPNDSFTTIFENIGNIGYSGIGYSYWHFSSSIFYLVLMKKFLNIEAPETEPELTKLVETIAIAISYYDPSILVLNNLNEVPKTDENSFKSERIQLLSCIVGAGHHLDHCRGGFSNVLNSYHVKYIVKNFLPGSQYEDTMNIKVTEHIKKITYVLLKTLFVTEYLNTPSLTELGSLIDRIDEVFLANEDDFFIDLCETNLQNRFFNDDGTITTFYLLSTNFEVAFRTIFEEKNISTSFTKDGLFDQIKVVKPLKLPSVSIVPINKIKEFQSLFKDPILTYKQTKSGNTVSLVGIDLKPNKIEQVIEKIKLMSRKFIINILLGNYDSIEFEDDNGITTNTNIFEEKIKYGMILSLREYTGNNYNYINNFFRLCDPDIIKNTIHNTREGQNKITLVIDDFLSEVGTPEYIKTFGNQDLPLDKFSDTDIIKNMVNYDFLNEIEKSRRQDIIQKINKYFGDTSTKKLKGKDIIYYIILFYSLFIEVLDKLCDKEDIKKTDLSILYRGSETTSLQYQKTYEKNSFKTKINALTSTSTDIQTSIDFARGKNLFIISYSPYYIPGLFVKDISFLPEETEFLFPPSIIFKNYVNIPNCEVSIKYSNGSVYKYDRHETIELLGIKNTDYIKQPSLPKNKPRAGKLNLKKIKEKTKKKKKKKKKYKKNKILSKNKKILSKRNKNRNIKRNKNTKNKISIKRKISIKNRI